MADVHQELLDAFEKSRERPKVFQSLRDEEGQDRLVREHVDKLGAAIVMIPRSSKRHPEGDGASTGVDQLDGDILDPQFSEKAVKHNVRCLVDHNPSMQKLTKFGIDEQRDVVFHIPFSALRDLGLVEENGRRFRGVAIGDIFVWDGTFYIAREAHRTSYFGQTNTNFFTSAFCSRYSHNTHSRNIQGPGKQPYVTDVYT